MIKLLRRQFIFHRRATVLLVLCYMISIIFISIGTSYLQETRRTTIDNNLGDSDKKLSIDVKYNGSPKELIRFLTQQNKYDIKISMNLNIGNRTVKISGHGFQKDPLWKPNILNGSYLLGDHCVAVGKNLEKMIIKKNNQEYLDIGNDRYKVKGIIGRENTPVVWNEYIYMSLKDFYNNEALCNNDIGDLDITYLSDKVMDENEKQYLINNLNAKFSKMEFSDESKYDKEFSVIDDLRGYILIFVLILTVSIVNIAGLSVFWIMDKTKEIGLRKALGFTNVDIVFNFLKEMFSIGVFSVALALIFQFALNMIISKMFKMDLIINLYNLSSSIILVLFVILLTSFIPIRNIMKTNIKEIISN